MRVVILQCIALVLFVISSWIVGEMILCISVLVIAGLGLIEQGFHLDERLGYAKYYERHKRLINGIAMGAGFIGGCILCNI